MWGAVWRIERRKCGPWYVGSLMVLVGAVLFLSRPLGAGDAVPALLGALQGWAIAFALFRESPGTASFMFSRPFSRARLFWYRWALGLGLQAVTVAVLAALLAFGAREAFQVHLRDSVWYPMVKWHELSVLGTLAAVSLFAYQTTCFVVVRNALLRGGASVGRRGASLVVVVLIITVIMLGLLTVSCAPTAAPAGASLHIPYALRQLGLAYLAVLTVLTTLGSLCGYRHLEVPA